MFKVANSVTEIGAPTMHLVKCIICLFSVKYEKFNLEPFNF